MVLFGHPRRAEGRSQNPEGGGASSYVVGLLPLPIWNRVDGYAKIWEGLAPHPPRPPAPTALPLSTKEKKSRDLAALQELLFAKLVSLVVDASPCPSPLEI